MKKIFLLAAASMVMFACSKDNESSIPTPKEKGVVFEISAVNQLSTKTRPLFSQQALQQVQRVNIYVFKQSGANYLYNKTFNVPNWSLGTSFQRYTVPAASQLDTASYSFLVVGQEATDNYTLTTPVVNTTTPAQMTASITAAGNASEIFAGTQNATVSSAGVRVSMQMTRQVAGILGYFKNVPAILNGATVRYLRLSVTNVGTGVYLSTGNGSTSTGVTYNVINADLSGQAVTSTGVYAGNNLSAQGVIKVANSQLFGQFMLPVGNVRMTLGLYDANNNPLKTWAIQNGQSTTMNFAANYFYALGQKVSNGDTTGGGTPSTGDDDAPIDLLQDQVISVTIDPTWNTIVNLTLNNNTPD